MTKWNDTNDSRFENVKLGQFKYVSGELKHLYTYDLLTYYPFLFFFASGVGFERNGKK